MEFFPVGPLAVWSHAPKGSKKPRARVLLIHGICEHSARHLNTVNFLNSIGIEVVRFDLRGMGQSGGRRQYIDSFEDYVQDCARTFHWIEQTLPPAPLFVLGHSLGGAVAIYYTAFYRSEHKGLILSAPAYLTGTGVSPLKIKVGRLLEPFFPTMQIPGATDYTAISRDEEVQKTYKEDPLACHFNTLRQGNSILNALEKIPEKCERIHIPTLIVHGTKDRIIRPEGSKTVFDSLASQDKTLKELDGVLHEPHNDHGKEDYFGIIKEWLDARI